MHPPPARDRTVINRSRGNESGQLQ
jgi:hypothetical protein